MTDPALTIAFLSVSAEMGGSEVSLLELVRGLRRLAPQTRMHVIVPRAGLLSRAAEQVGAQAHTLAIPARLMRMGESATGATAMLGRGASLLLAAGSVRSYSGRLRALLTSLSPDIVHTNGFKMHVLGARVTPEHAALVWHIHEYIARRPLSRRLLRTQVARCAAIVANSKSVATEVEEVLSPGVPVSTVYNAVDSREFAPEGETVDLDRLSNLPPAGAGTVRVGLVATYGRWKGHDVFIDALRRVRASVPVRGYIVGGSLYDTASSQFTREELERTIANAGLAGRVGLTGFVERPAAALRALDVVVHASTQPEPFGLVIAEGMASARAVVVSAAGGAAELVHDGVDALTHTPGDAASLAVCIDRLAADPSLRAKLGAAGRASALRRFDPDVFTRAFINVYDAARAHAMSHGRH